MGIGAALLGEAQITVKASIGLPEKRWRQLNRGLTISPISNFAM